VKPTSTIQDPEPTAMPTILVDDDDPSLREVMRRSLEREGYRVLVAEDGMAGARRWRAEGAHLIVLDIQMPEMDGIELLVQVRTRAPRLPIVVISGGDQTRNLDLLGDAHLLGATAVLEKPFTIEQLSHTVARLLRVEGGQHHTTP
jgi:two-component system response regulator MprA